MTAFLVPLENRPGALAAVLEAIAPYDVNVMFCAVTVDERGALCLVAQDEGAVSRALDEAGLTYAERAALTVRLPNRPGTGASLARTLAANLVNIEAFLPVEIGRGEAAVVLVVDDLDTARACVQAAGGATVDD